jgi:DNA polymerase III subunit delta'
MNEFEAPPSHDHLKGYPQPCESVHIFGHDAQIEFLNKAYQGGKLHHALLLDGPRGIGKASLAFMFARHILTHQDAFHAPNFTDGRETQHHIQQILNHSHPQIFYLTRAFDQKNSKHQTELTIKEVRKIGHFLHHTSSNSGFRIVIIDPVDDMNVNTANALLKNLEEPATNTLFLLISHSSGSLLPTIRSRCLMLKFQPLDNKSMGEALAELRISGRLESEQLQTLISKSGGSIRNAIILFDQGGLDIIQALDDILTNKVFNAAQALKLGEAVSSRETEPLFQLLCDYMIKQFAGHAHDYAAHNLEQAQQFAQIHDELVEKIRTTLEYNLDKRHLVLNIIMQIHQKVMG